MQPIRNNLPNQGQKPAIQPIVQQQGTQNLQPRPGVQVPQRQVAPQTSPQRPNQIQPVGTNPQAGQPIARQNLPNQVPRQTNPQVVPQNQVQRTQASQNQPIQRNQAQAPAPAQNIPIQQNQPIQQRAAASQLQSRGGPQPGQVPSRVAPTQQQRNPISGANRQTQQQNQRPPAHDQQPDEPQVKTDLNCNPPPPNTIYPISSLNLWNPRWTIKARVTYKSPMKNYSNDKGAGCLFSVNFLDASGEISCSLFNELAQKYWEIFEEGKIFYISKGKIKNAGKWNPVACDFELSLNNQSEVMECTLGDDSIPNITYKFVGLSSLLEYGDGKLVDVLCVLSHVGDCVPLTTKAGKELIKRELILVDNSGDDPNTAISVIVVLWNEVAQNFNLVPSTIVVIKGARVQVANGGVGLAFNPSTKIQYAQALVTEPGQPPQWQEIGEWFENLPTGSFTHCLTQTFQPNQAAGSDVLLSLKEGREQAIGKDKPFYFTIRGTVMMIKHDDHAPLFYTSCPSPECRKKVQLNDTNMWECLKCKEAFTTMVPRYILSMVVADHSGSQWMGCFDDAGKILLGVDATTVWNYRAVPEEEPLLQATFQRASYKSYMLKIKAFEEPYQDEMKLKCSIVGVEPIDYLAGGQILTDMILAMRT